MRKLVLPLLLVFVLSVSAHAGDAGKRTVVLTSLDVIQAMGEVLTRGTSINVVNVIPKGYSMEGHEAYFKKYREALFAEAVKSDAVLSVASLWSEDPLYKWARRGNIRIVDIDAGKSLDGYGAGVPLVKVHGKSSPFAWRSPASLTRMASIVSADLSRLVPSQAGVIKANLKRFQSSLFKLRSRYEMAFTLSDSVDLASLTAGYVYLVDEFGLDVHFHFLKPEGEWSAIDEKELVEKLCSNEVRVVVCPWEPDEKGRRVIEAAGAVPVVLKRYVRAENEEALASLVSWYDANLLHLLQALGR